MYASPDTAVPFAAALVGFCVLERILNAVATLFLPKSSKQAASVQLLISLSDCVFTAISGAGYCLVSLALALLKWLAWVTVILFLGSMIYVLYEEFPWVLTDMARGYNAYLGPFMQGTVVTLFQALNIAFKGIVPLWNGSVFFISRLVSGFMLPTVFEQLDPFISLGGVVLSLVKHGVLSLSAYVSSVVVDCPASSGDACYDVSLRTLDLLTPMADVREGAKVFVQMTRSVCGYADPIVDAISYPLMDANLAGAVHNIGNAALYFFVQMSEVTYLRCLRHGGEAALMCTPDAEPVYTFLSSGLTSLGYLIDNWLDVVFVIVQNALGFQTISCSAQAVPTTLDPGPLRASLFPSNQTIIVGLTGYLMAVTDGSVVAYEGKGSIRIASWPSAVNISYGAAAVSYGLASDADVSGLASGGTSTSLLGCICAHDPTLGMQVQCSVLPFNGLLANETGVVPVFFQEGSTTQKSLGCGDVDIIVQSVRWPATRFSGGVGNLDCATAKTCNKVDATVWVIPRAGACDFLSTLCDCYPYCMAARLSGSTTAPLILYSAQQWKGNVYMLNKDCNIHAVSAGFVGSVSGALSSTGVATVQSDASGAQFVTGALDTVSCLDNLLVTSIIDRSLHPAYDTPTQAYLRNPDAPFAITGDTIMTQVLHGDGTYTVKIERLTGASGDEFTLSVVSSNFPANPPPNVPSALFSQYPKDSLTIPYARLGTLGVSSRDYVFFAVNPSVEVFGAYLDYCANRYKGTLPQFGLIMVSSYSPIRIWRVEAYRRCTQSGCGANLVLQADIPDAFSDGTFDSTSFSSDCLQTYNDAITQMEYVNELNLAVTVRNTDVNQSFVKYRTYWLNIETMELGGPGLPQTGPWVKSAPVTASGSTVLCPAMQILPQLGSLVTQLIAAAMFLVKMPLDSVLYTPGILNLWSQGLVCPLQTRGHTILQQCGANAFSLDDFFDSLQAATDIFWAGLTFVSSLVSNIKSTDFVQNALNGIARYGAGSIDLWSARFKVLSVLSAGPSTILNSLPTGFLMGGRWAQGALKISSNMLGWARFGYTCAVKMVVAITRNVLLNTPVGASGAWRIVINTLDEMRSAYDSYVVSNMRQSCAGISLMFGLTNPWAVFLYQQCLATSTVAESGLTLSLSLLNTAPFAQCMCAGTEGKVFAEHALQTCVPQASTALRPQLLKLIQAASSTMGSDTQAQVLCASMIQMTKADLAGSIQPWFDAQYASLNALADSVDYALAWADPTAGECLNIGHDPNVVVILPWPQDYFHGCGATTLCRSKCSALWDAFDQSYANSGGAPTAATQVTVMAESLFFPTISAEAFTPMAIMAVIQPGEETCNLVCGRIGDPCAAVGGVKNTLAVVQYYCIPSAMAASVYRSQNAGIEWQAAGSANWTDTLTQLQFGDRDGRFLVGLTSAGEVYMASAIETVRLATLANQTADVGYPVLYLSAIFTVFNPPYACINLNVIYRLAGGQITAQPMHRKLIVDTGRFPPAKIEWRTLGATDFFAQLQGFSPSVITSSTYATTIEYVLMPTANGVPMGLWAVKWDSNDATNGVLSAATTVLSTPTGMAALLGGGQTLSQSTNTDSEGAFLALVAAPPHQSTGWLSELRVSGVSASAYASQSIPVTVQVSQPCSVSSCIYCPDGEVQSLCDAVQECVVVNCIGTPVNMKRVLCQVGQTIADQYRESLALLAGSWGVFVDMYMILMKLSLQTGLTGIDIEWPDDRFFGYVCTLKDNNAHMISVLTSALNSVIQLSHSSQLYIQGGAGDIDPNFNALTTVQMTALTSLANQLFMAPIYMLIVSQKILMCRVNGLLAIFDATGFIVRVGKAELEQASSAMVGQCLTQNSVVKSANPADSSNNGAYGGIVSQVATSASMAILQGIAPQSQTLETLLHLIDAKISFFMGVVYGMADVLESMDLSHCKMPDSLLNETVFCACGDTPFQIPTSRRQEGLAQLGLWCTGTLSMLDAGNNPFVIYNPYTYFQLQAMASGSDAYLACMSGRTYVSGSSDCSSLLPSTPVLKGQGVSVLSVLSTCRNNYMKGQWDQAAHVLFNQSLFYTAVQNQPYPDIPASPSVVGDVGLCLADPSTRAGCLQAYLTFLGQDPIVYWGYVEGAPAHSQFIDACQVFTGPANSSALTPPQRSVFRACLDNFPDSNCQLSSNLWTPQSTNAVPVARMHGVILSGGLGVDQVVEMKYSEAYDLVMGALAPLKNYNNSAVLTVFFSPEGDIMHQMLDCVFMGPYNSVDYWPVDSDRILAIPEWYRDYNGSSRAVDPAGCVQASSDKSPPYSCGSPARQAVIKYFFRDYLQKQKNAVLKSVVGALVNSLYSAWNSTANYACLCADGRARSTNCCGQNSSAVGPGAWLPPALTTQYQTIPENAILRALTYQVESFYRFALETKEVWTKYLDNATLAGYDWSRPAPSAVATKEALYRTDQPVVKYDSTEVNSPMLATALWDQCHGLLSQVFFTIPMQGTAGTQWTPQGLPADPGPGTAGIKSLVQAAVNSAYAASPLFRHYNVSHIPSDSRMCRPHPAPNRTNVPFGSVKVSSYTSNGALLMDASGWPGLPAYGTDAFPVHGCFCGWPGDGIACQPPPIACPALGDLCPSFSSQSSSAIDLIKTLWDPAWPCPALAFGDHSGAMDTHEYDDWLNGVRRNYTVSGDNLLRRGRSGLRVGSWNTPQTQPSPADRIMEPGDAALPYCASSFARLSQKPLLDEGMLSAFVSGLFPVAQGVYESGTSAYCLRYLIEAGLLEAMTLVAQSDLNFQTRLAQQGKTEALWRRRCESQISLLALCKNLDAYQPPVDPTKRFYPCPFSVAARSTNDVYMTPGCLVQSGGSFYDPCNCPGFSCGPTKPVFASFVPSCRIPFDPRNLTVDAPLGRWRVSSGSWLSPLRPDVAGALLSNGAAVGNVPRTGNWATDEGFMNTTGLHCDMLTDWWPDGQSLPVGYHATVPCGSQETGYRTFDSAFAVQRTTGQFTVVKMVYQHDATRSAGSVDTESGAGGVCRGSNLGMPMYNTNVMRVCTRQLLGADKLDVAIPGLYPTGLPDSLFGPEACSTASTETPWFDAQGRQDSALHSVGTVPNIPLPSDTTYPPDGKFFGVGPVAQIESDLAAGGTGWGAGCSDYAIKECASNTDCPAGYYCFGSVCLNNDFATGSHCYRHDMCPLDRMCDGTGVCTDGYIIYLNNLDSPIEAPVFSEQCDDVGSDTYYTDGSSPWEYVPDWLEGHGMCSNKNWYLYSLNLQQAGTCKGTSCAIDSRATSLPLNSSLWWPVASPQPKLFPVMPTICDRDYEHMAGPSAIPMRGCAPKGLPNNQVTDTHLRRYDLNYASLFRNYNGRLTALGKLPTAGLNKTGFLGVPEPALWDGVKTTFVENCEAVQNCYAYTFTFNGIPQAQRWYNKGSSLAAYDNNDIFRCGVGAYFDTSASKCRLDTRVLPLYAALCQPQASTQTPSAFDVCTCNKFQPDAIGCRATVDATKLRGICPQISNPYSASYTTIKTNTKYLQALFGVFIQSDGTLQAQVSGVECFQAIYTSMNDWGPYGAGTPVGVYFPWDFVLYEVPLAWVYQCTYVAGLVILPQDTGISCAQSDQALTLDQAETIQAKAPQFRTTDFGLVQGGYSRANVLKGIQQFRDYIHSAIPDAGSISEAQESCSKMLIPSGSCSMVPYCPSRLDWIPHSQMDANMIEFLAGGYQPLSCGGLAMVYALGGQRFSDYVAQKTVAQNYHPYAPMPWTNGAYPDINGIIETTIDACISQTYNTNLVHPLQFNFDDSLGDCIDFAKTVNNIANSIKGAVDSQYAPSTNTGTGRVVSLTDQPAPDSQCIFNDLADQQKFYNPDSNAVSCIFSQGGCNPACARYPLTYQVGGLACSYPVNQTYTSLLGLVEYVWADLKPLFLQNLQNLPPFVPIAPTALPFFNGSQTFFHGWTYNALNVQSYISNINPDTSKEVMCLATSAANAVNFTVCNDANYAALGAFTDSLRQQGAAIVPPNTQLRWQAAQSFLSNGALFAFANHTREDAEVLLASLFNTNTRCGVGEQMFNRVCLLQTTGASATVKPWVPWMSGEWNPYEFCDVQLQELSQGNQEMIWPYDLTACPDCPRQNGQYRTSYMFDPLNPSCDSRQKTYAKQVDVDPTAPTNLCYVRMINEDNVCRHAQGMVGGERGQTVLNNPKMPHLYGTTNLSVPPNSSGIFPRAPNSLLTGADASSGQYGFLSIPGDELGVTTLGLSVDPVAGGVPYLRVARLPLQADTGFLGSMASQDVSNGWVQGLGAAYQSEDALHFKEQSTRGNAAWDCPARRAAFYSGAVGAEFVPILPSPGRARRMFAHLTQNLSAHPTVMVERDGSRLGAYLTANGFCFCPDGLPSDQTQCLIPLSNTAHNCSLKRTIDGLRGAWIQSFAHAPAPAGGGDATCQMQFDWPYVGGTLRDGTTYDGDYAYASDPLNRRCHVLDRLRPFLYRYVPKGGVSKSGATTLDPGGVCHTGRAAQAPPAVQAKFTTTRCVKQGETDLAITVSCEDGTALTLNKEQSNPLDAMVTGIQTARASCSQCSPPPTFASPNGSSIPPESSFGIPFRFSAERAAANDLKALLGGQLLQYNITLNATAWANGRFFGALLNNPSTLFLNIPKMNPNTPEPPPPSDPAWDSQWVFCNTTDALKSGQCLGSIRESDWRADRFQSCYKTINTMTRDSPGVMSSVDVCLTDSRLAALCEAVSQAQKLVTEANCLASGSKDCMLKPYLYTPGAWDTSNKEFVHQTVRRFYSRITTYACPDVSELVQANNEAVLNRCAATPVSAMYLALQACRDIVDTLALVLFYMANILLDVVQMIGGSNIDSLKLEVIFNWNAMTGQLVTVIPIISDLIFDMLFRLGNTGQKLYGMLQSSCSYVNIAYHYWLDVWCTIAIDLLPMVLLAVREVTSYCEVAFRVLNDSLGVIFRFMVPDALSAMETLGYTTTFRDQARESQSREKQTIHDSLVKSKKEGKSADAAGGTALGISAAAQGSVAAAFQTLATGAVVAGLSDFASNGGLVGAATGLVMDLGQTIYQNEEMSRLLSLLPGNWTLFDFTTIYVAIDAFDLYVSSDQQCLNFRAAGPTDLLSCSFPPLATADQLRGANLVATRCWADAQQSIGTSNLLSCTDSDTCYKSLYDTNQVVCINCPEPGPSYNLYGCSPVTSMCTCGVPTSTPDRCTSNEECYYSSATCLLVTGLDSMSYGNQPCAQCSKQVECLVRDGSGVGQCGCVFQPQASQQCSQPPGELVDITDPQKMCGYLPSADRTQPLTLAHWDALAITPCSYLDPTYVYCAQVYQPSGVVPMAVGLVMASLTQSFSSRRLLSEGMLHPERFELHNAESEYALPDTPAMHSLLLEDWNHTAAPCSGLAWAYQQAARDKSSPDLGPLDTMYLHRCAYWRQVGRETVRVFNLTALARLDGFLLSLDDFAAALSHKSVLVQLVRSPEALLFAAGRAPILKPVHAALLAVRSLGVSVALGRNRTNQTMLPPLHHLWEQAWQTVQNNTHRRETAQRETAQRENAQRAKETQRKKKTQNVKETHQTCSNCTGRKLMASNIVLAQNWVAGSYSWPPVYYAQLQSTRCAIGTALVQILHDILQVLTAFYTGAFTPPPPPPNTLFGNLPNFSGTAQPTHPPSPNSEGWIASVYSTLRSWVGLDAGVVRGFFGNQKGTTNIFTISTSMLRCDFAALTFCSEHKKDLLLSAVLLVILYILVAYVSSLAGIPVVGTLFIMASLPILMWYVYGTAFTCAPMIPTCLMDDVVSILNSTFPEKLDVPHYLKVSDGCLESDSAACFKSCSDAPMRYSGWRDTLAYGLCGASVPWCRSLAGAIGQRDSLSSSLLAKADIVMANDPTLLSSMDFCFAVSLGNLIPVFLLAVLGLTALAYIVYLPFLLIPRFLSVGAQALAYSHA